MLVVLELARILISDISSHFYESFLYIVVKRVIQSNVCTVTCQIPVKCNHIFWPFFKNVFLFSRGERALSKYLHKRKKWKRDYIWIHSFWIGKPKMHRLLYIFRYFVFLKPRMFLFIFSFEESIFFEKKTMNIDEYVPRKTYRKIAKNKEESYWVHPN